MTPHIVRRQALVAVTLALLALGCEGGDLAATLGPGGTTTDLIGQTARALVGRWFSVVSASDVFGVGHVTETTWEFVSDGTATRTVTVRTALGQVVEVAQTRLLWRAGVGVLILEFGPPSFRILRVPFAIDYGIAGTVLYLDGVPFLRVGP